MQCTFPTTPSEIGSFLELAGYYKIFIQDFSKIMKLMTCLTKKGVSFHWVPKQQLAFEMLRTKLCEALVLALLKGVDDMIIYCNVPIMGFRAFLMQRGQVIAYASRQMKPHEAT